MKRREHVMFRMMLLSLAGHVVLLVVAISPNWVTATAVRPGRAAFGPAVSYVHLVNLPPASPAPPAGRPPRTIPGLPAPRPVAPAKTVAPGKTAAPSPPSLPSLQDWWRRQMASLQPHPIPLGRRPDGSPPPHPLQGYPMERERGEVTPAPDAALSSHAAVPATTAVASVEGPAFPFPSYLTAIQEKVAGHWSPPRLGVAGGPGPGPGPGDTRQVIVGFVLGRTGQVSRLAVEQGSGEPAQDEAALRAVILAQPFPPLPEGLRPPLQVHFRFTLRSGLAAGAGADE